MYRFSIELDTEATAMAAFSQEDRVVLKVEVRMGSPMGKNDAYTLEVESSKGSTEYRNFTGPLGQLWMSKDFPQEKLKVAIEAYLAGIRRERRVVWMN